MRAVRPTRKLLLLFLPGVALAAWATAVPWLLLVVGAFDLVLVAAFLIDARAADAHRPRVTRALPKSVMRDQPFSITYTIENRSRRSMAIAVEDRFPADVEPREVSLRAHLPAGGAAAGGDPAGTRASSVIRSVALSCRRRGRHALSPPTVTLTGPLGLARSSGQVDDGDDGASSALSVIADVSALGRFEALRRRRRLHEMGIAQTRARGQGTEVDALRPYAVGDPYAAVSWKATARRGRPVVRETRAERRQNVLLVLDCGRRMAREVAGRSRLDHAIEAALLLGDVAIRSDDRVGLVAFAERMTALVPPRGGVAQLHTLATATHALEPALREPPYLTITGAILARFPRRGLTVFFTDAMEPSSLEALAGCVRQLAARHLVLVVLFKDEYIERSRHEAIHDAADLFRIGAASDLGLERAKALEGLRRAGALVIEAAAESLSTSVVNRYLEVKAAHLI
jgi:uncharacterized protein (DUF58 family)